MARRLPQWLIIQGRAPGELLAGTASAERPRLRGLQHPHDAGCAPPDRFGALALRSLVAWASRRPASMPDRHGADSSTRGAGPPHPAQGCGAWNSAIGRIASNGPQRGQSYS